MASFQKGDIIYHKATHKRCVVAGNTSNGKLWVTDQDDKQGTYAPEEFWTEQEWDQRNANLMAQAPEPDLDPFE